MSDDRQEWLGQIAKCVRCGSCRSVCPVFKATGTENFTARGKVKLIESVAEGSLDLTRVLQERMGSCLMCKACESGCPSGVKTGELYLSVRRALAERHGLPLAKKLVFGALTYRRLFEMGLSLGSVFQHLVLKDAPGGAGKVSRFPIPAAGLNYRRLLPPLAPKPLRAMVPAVSSAGGGATGRPRARVAFFPGCMLSYVYPGAGKAVVDILTANGVEVVLPEALCCCGVPAYTSGDFAAARYLAGRNVDALSAGGFDAVITGCATCGSALKHEYGLVIEDPQERERWENLSGKVHDVAQYLADTGYSTDFGEVRAKITYHDPCHLIRGMGVAQAPRDMLKAIPGVEFAEMKDAASCCGCAGSFSLTHYGMSRTINDAKIKAIADTGAQTLVTGCSACRMHIADGLARNTSGVEAVHTAQFIAKAYRAAKKRA